ncbi:MAG: ubiquinol-cytochrome c reductase iron-sulfur subunit [Vicinamibacteria bacterium]
MTDRSQDQLTVPPDGRPEADQPGWRKDFPIDWPQDRYVSQRDFIKFLLLTSLAFVVGQFGLVFESLFGRKTRDLPSRPIARGDELPVGGSLVFHYPEANQPRLLVRLAEGTFAAYGQKCTHLTCPVIPRVSSGELHCPCHQGIFDLRTGQPIAGPPRRALPRVRLEIREGVVYAVGVEGEPL